MKKILIATKNKHKVEEFKAMLTPLQYEVISLLNIDRDFAIEETGTTFEENAYIKAKAIYDALHMEVISDDSGICINHLNGAPGVYSARFLGEDTSYEYKNNYILKELKEAQDRGAQYVCSICHFKKDGTHEIFTGKCEGEIAYEPLGSHGFGYDPIFYYPPFKTTLANVSEAEKNSISHRAIALKMLMKGMK
ncbi:MAG: RdgB/HAM1 family non-canonical purine NTP pyrophosphatase [Erysipelotrichia bacterium]|nr:RdgB/HAM1 family non-canonical purine NTP pyrophosphatase [Erysipelotrichia bacterium]